MSALAAVKEKAAQINETVTRHVFGKKNKVARKINVKNKNLRYLNNVPPVIVAFLAMMANAVLVGITLLIGVVIFSGLMVGGLLQIINRSFEGAAQLAGKFYRLRKVRKY